MTTRLALIALTAFALVAGAAPAVTAQQAGTQQQAQAQAEQAKGELVKVDADGKTLSVKTSDGAELTFSYDDNTEIKGASGAQGLATAAGSKVTVHYTMKDQTRIATKVEVDAAR
jgi:YD repeat-containing protein